MELVPEDFNHPEKFYEGLLWAPDGELPDADFQKCFAQGIRARPPPDFKDYELCWSCGWKTRLQLDSTYGSRVRIAYTHANSGLWYLGSKLLLKDISNDGYSPGNDYITYEFLRSQQGLKILLIKKMEILSQPNDKTYILCMSRAEGGPLANTWRILSDVQKEHIRDQLLAILQELRQSTSSRPQAVDGSKLEDRIIGSCPTLRPFCQQIGSNTNDWFENMSAELRVGLAKIHKTEDPDVIEAEVQKLKNKFPDPEPYVLTHRDLTLGNIMVEGDEIIAIIDWEYARYYPWWIEAWFAKCFSQDQL
jgi:hypothetical protein